MEMYVRLVWSCYLLLAVWTVVSKCTHEHEECNRKIAVSSISSRGRDNDTTFTHTFDTVTMVTSLEVRTEGCNESRNREVPSLKVKFSGSNTVISLAFRWRQERDKRRSSLESVGMKLEDISVMVFPRNRTIKVDPPVVTDVVWVSFLPPSTCLRVTIHGCVLPEARVGAREAIRRARRAAREYASEQKEYTPKLLSPWLQLVIFGALSVAMLATLPLLIVLCCHGDNNKHQHHQLTNHESPFHRNNRMKMGSPDSTKKEFVDSLEFRPRADPLGSPTFSTFGVVRVDSIAKCPLDFVNSPLTSPTLGPPIEAVANGPASPITPPKTGPPVEAVASGPTSPITPPMTGPPIEAIANGPASPLTPPTTGPPKEALANGLTSPPMRGPLETPQIAELLCSPRRSPSLDMRLTSCSPDPSNSKTREEEVKPVKVSEVYCSPEDEVEGSQQDGASEKPLRVETTPERADRQSESGDRPPPSLPPRQTDGHVDHQSLIDGGGEGEESSLDRGVRSPLPPPIPPSKVLKRPAKRRLPTDQVLETQKSALEGPMPRRLGKGFLPATCAMPFRPVCPLGPPRKASPNPLGPPRKEPPISRRPARLAMCPTRPVCPIAFANIVGGGVVCSMCGQEMSRLPVDDNGEPVYLTLIPGSRLRNGVGMADSNEVGGAPHTVEKSKGGELKTGMTYHTLQSRDSLVCLDCLGKQNESPIYHELEPTTMRMEAPTLPPRSPRAPRSPRPNNPYERVASLKREQEPIKVKFGDICHGYSSEEGSYISAGGSQKPRSLLLRHDTSTDYESLPSSSPHYQKASDVRHIAAMFESRGTLPPSSAIKPPPLIFSKGESSDSHDYESLRSFDQDVSIGTKRGPTYAKIEPILDREDQSPTSPPFVPSGASRAALLKIDSQGYALVLQRDQYAPEAEADEPPPTKRRGSLTPGFTVKNPEEAWKYQQDHRYAPLTIARNKKRSKRRKKDSKPCDYEVPVLRHSPQSSPVSQTLPRQLSQTSPRQLSQPSPRLVRQKAVWSTTSETEQTTENVKMSVSSTASETDSQAERLMSTASETDVQAERFGSTASKPDIQAERSASETGVQTEKFRSETEERRAQEEGGHEDDVFHVDPSNTLHEREGSPPARESTPPGDVALHQQPELEEGALPRRAIASDSTDPLAGESDSEEMDRPRAKSYAGSMLPPFGHKPRQSVPATLLRISLNQQSRVVV